MEKHIYNKVGRWAHGLLSLGLIALILLLAACSNIADDERLIYVKPAAAKRAVLLEDFTGQRCVNCPRGTEVIEQLQRDYGDSVVIAVGIHGGPLGFKGSATVKGLATDLGDDYYNHWNLEYQPVGLINRHGAVNYSDWTAKVKEALAVPATLTLKADAFIVDQEISIGIEAMGTDGTTTGKLQVWLIEDNITAMQLMPDGSANADYVHNHVLRATVNGPWGDDFTIKEGETKGISLAHTLDSTWDASQLSVVAFVYNDQGVAQATKAKVNGQWTTDN